MRKLATWTWMVPKTRMVVHKIWCRAYSALPPHSDDYWSPRSCGALSEGTDPADNLIQLA